MNEDAKIQHVPSGTRCYCGSSESYEFCATCRAYLIENGPRIWLWFSAWWRSVTEYAEILTPKAHDQQAHADAIEQLNLGVYLARRFLG